MQQVWLQLAALVTNSFGHWVWAICRREKGVLSFLCLIWVLLNDHFRYCNMDYLFASSIRGAGLWLITISYDVACQWFVRFWWRVPFLPHGLGASLSQFSIRTLVPKLHLQNHDEGCHSTYSFNFSKGATQTDGEGVERNWDDLNGQGPSTSEMLSGTSWNTLDDCCAWANWRKTTGVKN